MTQPIDEQQTCDKEIADSFIQSLNSDEREPATKVQPSAWAVIEDTRAPITLSRALILLDRSPFHSRGGRRRSTGEALERYRATLSRLSEKDRSGRK